MIGGLSFPMVETPAGSGLYSVSANVAALVQGQSYPIRVVWHCGSAEQSQPVGTIVRYDPSGFITDARTGQPIPGATVTLYEVPGWSARTGDPATAAENTCQSNSVREPGAAWSQPAPTEFGVVARPDSGRISPAANPQTTGGSGYYAWDVAAGCWYIEVSAPGYRTTTSPVVGVPSAVTDLNLTLEPLSSTTAVFLPLVQR